VQQLLTTIEVSEHKTITEEENLVEETEEVEEVKTESVSSSQLNSSVEDELPSPVIEALMNAITIDNIAQFQQIYEENDITDPISLFHSACSQSRLAFVKYLLGRPEKDILLNSMNPSFSYRPALCLAASKGDLEMIQLLLDSGANPCYGGTLDNKKPYDFCKNKEARNVFRTWAGSLKDSKFDWTDAHFEPLTAEDIEKQQKLKADKKKRKKKVAQEKQKVQQVEEKKEKEQQEYNQIAKQREDKLKSMSDREVRALAAELRLGVVKNKCDNPKCGKQFSSVPFTKFTFSYCSIECVKEHNK